MPVPVRVGRVYPWAGKAVASAARGHYLPRGISTQPDHGKA